MKKTALFAWLVGILLIAVGIVLGVIQPATSYAAQTVWERILLSLFLFGGALILTAFLLFVFSKAPMGTFSWKQTLLALLFSATTALGAYCVQAVLFCFLMSRPEQHPITFPASLLLGVLSFILLFLWGYLYRRTQRKQPTPSGALLDILLALIYLVPFFFAVWSAHSVCSLWLV